MMKARVLSLITLFLLAAVTQVSAKKLKILNAVVSSVQDDNLDFKAKKAIDRNYSTRWSSKFSDLEWIYFDLGKIKNFNTITIYWENAFAKKYKIQISNDKKHWKNVFEEAYGNGKKDVIWLKNRKARYIRLYNIKRGTGWGYSIYEVLVMNIKNRKLDFNNKKIKGAKSSAHIKIKRAFASSIQDNNTELSAKNSIDGNPSTRWSSEFSDLQWILFDLGKKKEFNVLTISWENAFARAYKIEISNNKKKWKTIYTEKYGQGGREVIRLELHKARFIRLYCTKRATGFGYSIYDVNIVRCDFNPPSPPRKCKILHGNNIICVTWQDNTEPDIYGYNIYRFTPKNSIYKKLNNTVIYESKYTDKKVKKNRKYYYIVRAIDYLGNESKDSVKLAAVVKPIKRKGTYLDSKLSIENRVKDLLSRMILEEKIEQLSGIPNYAPYYDGMTTYSNERLGIPPLKCTDGPYGVRWWPPSTAFPVSIALSSTWDTGLIKKVYTAIAKEVLTMGRNQSLGPCLNLSKDPRGGRTFEGFGEDIYLTTRMAVSAIKGIQSQKVIATPKHFICNNIETGRSGGPVKIDERTLRSIYLPAFEACIKEANAWSIMSAYNKINGYYCSANKHILRDILKNEWGFKGFVISDWFAAHNTVKSANYGLDVEMPTPIYYGKSLLIAVKRGFVSMDTIDDMVSRVLRVKFLAGLFDKRKKINKKIIESKLHTQLSLKAARESIVLLKNKNNILPLDKNEIKTIAVLGPNADKTTVGEGLGSSQLHSSYIVTPLQGIKNKINGKIKIISNPENADIVIVFVGLTESIAGRVEGEGIDRTYLHLPGKQEELINEIVRKNKNIIVVLIGGTAITMGKWIKNVPAVIEAWYCGQEGGTAIADVLFGDYNPAGRLPITFPTSIKQLPKLTWNYKNEYKTGIGYCYYEKKGLEPLFPFGYGLSYTKFKYSNLKISHRIGSNGIVSVSFDIKNIGKRKGDEVVQLYLQDIKKSVDGPIKQLKRFHRITLNQGEKVKVKFKLLPNDMALLDKKMKRVVEPGLFKVLIGSSSRDIKLSGEFEIKKFIKIKD